MSFAAATRRFAAIATRERALTWPVTVTLPDASSVEIAKSGTKSERMQNDHGTGWVKRTTAVFSFPLAGSFVPTVGAEWTITAAEVAADFGTSWRCFDLLLSSAGTEHRCVCFRLD